VTNGNGCVWTAVSNAPWITITSGASGNNGSGTVGYSVAANASGAPRSGDHHHRRPDVHRHSIRRERDSSICTGHPCRIADTRNPNGPFGGPSIGAGGSRDFVIPAGACAIHSNAAAYSLNLTVVPLGSLGFLSVWPAGQPQPTVSTLNSSDGRVKANAVIVPAGVNGGITVFASNPTNAVIDINGYFIADPGGAALAYYPLTPCRIADTRAGTGTFAGPALAANVTRDFPIQSSPCNVPANARAYALT